MFWGDVIFTTGTRAYFTPCAIDVELPARSVAMTAIEFCPRFSTTSQAIVPPLTVAGAPLHVTPARPERASETEPLADAVGVSRVTPSAGSSKARVGAVRSMLTV